MHEYSYIRPLHQLPVSVEAVTVMDSDGNYNVYVNTKLTADKQQQAYSHEIRHIRLQHFYNFDPIVVNEIEAG